MKKLFIAVVVLSAIAVAESKYICKVSHIGINAVAISCTNGADPTGTKVGNAVIMSCGK